MKKLIAFLLMMWCSVAHATTFSDLEFGAAQFSDTQWNVSACLYTTTCQIYSLSGIGTSWNTGSPYHISSTQHIGFIAGGNPSYPWQMIVYNSNGSIAANLGNGKLSVQGAATDSSGHHFFFFINANYNGTVFSTDYGFPNSNGFSFTGTLNPTAAQTNSFASTGSTTPLAAGQSAAPPAPTYPPAVISQMEQNYINQTSTIGYNTVYINQYGGDNTSVTVTQTGDFNAVRGPNGQPLNINGAYNTLTVTQGGQTLNGYNNLVEANITGSVNSLKISQVGNFNYEQALITGNNNTMSNTQSAGQNLFQNVNGSGNNVTTSQTGSGNHFLELNIPTNGNTVNVTQSGSAQKMFSLTLNTSNTGVTVTQDNPTTADSASMSITCTTGSCTGYSYVKH